MRLKNRDCIVTGAAIGRATALKFAGEGAIVIACDRHPDAVDGAENHVVDVTDREQVDARVAAVRQRHGRIDVLVNNAGITKDARL